RARGPTGFPRASGARQRLTQCDMAARRHADPGETSRPPAHLSRWNRRAGRGGLRRGAATGGRSGPPGAAGHHPVVELDVWALLAYPGHLRDHLTGPRCPAASEVLVRDECPHRDKKVLRARRINVSDRVLGEVALYDGVTERNYRDAQD